MGFFSNFIDSTAGQIEPPSENNVIELLKADHEKVRGLFKQFEESEDKAELGKLLQNIIEELSVHAAAEEKLVYPRIQQEDKDKAAEANEEHHIVKMIVAELAGYNGSEEIVKTKVKVLSELVEHHVKEEEGELMPMLERSGANLDELGQQVKAEKEKMLKSKSVMPKKTSHRTTKAKAAPAKGRARAGTGRSTAEATAAKKKTAAKRKSTKSTTTATKSRGTTKMKATAKKRGTTMAKAKSPRTTTKAKAKASRGSKGRKTTTSSRARSTTKARSKSK